MYDIEKDVQDAKTKFKNLQYKNNNMSNEMHIHKLELNNLSKEIDQKTQMLSSLKYKA